MELKRGRKILCLLLSIVFAVGTILALGASICKITLCSSEFMDRRFNGAHISELKNESYNAQLEALAAESGIPVEVFKTAQEEFIITEDAVHLLFSGNDASMYSNDKIEITEKLCLEYINGNSLKYKKADIYRTAQKAAEIYSDCYGIKNAQALYQFISNFSQRATGITALGMLLIMLTVFMIFVMFTKKEKLIAQLCAVLTTGGFAAVLFAIAMLIVSIGVHILITPEAYASAIISAVRFDLFAIMIIGALISALGIYCAIKTNTKIIEKRINETE